ncbi:ABC transporter ATP-binding protein [Xylocopilactobacillus apicola]|nr:ABC transporter ATP-binding protein [Xylocopilactobacillus apicola]
MTIVFVLIIISAYANVSGALFLQTVIDQYITPLLKQNNPNFSGLLKAITTMGFVYLAGIFASLGFNLLMVKISEGTQQKIRNQMFKNLENLPVSYFDQNSHGDIMSHFTNDTDTLRQMISQSIPNLGLSAIMFISIFIAMISISPALTLFVVFTLTIMFFITKSLTSKSGKYFTEQQKDLGEENGFIEEMIHGQKVVKVFNHENAAIENFDEINDRLQESSTQANVIANTLMPVMFNLLNMQYVLLAVIGGMFSLYGISTFTVGMLAAFLQLSRSLEQPVSQFAQQINFIVMALAGAERIFNLMDQKTESDDGTVTLVKSEKTADNSESWSWKIPHHDGSITYSKLTGDIVFDHVSFGYVSSNIVLHDINIHAKPGQKIALVGATGAGKTTITNLLNRFYEIQEGQITYDGINLTKIEKNSLRHSLGIVLQDTNLFTGTIEDNIRFGKLDATKDEILSAAKLANADLFIDHLPKKYETLLLNNGEGLSQGQRQLLAIARAAVADPPVMILDEATSSIDTRTERIVQQGMDRLMKGRTVFVIAHRLSTIQNADVILVMDHGRIIERGNHEDLLEKHGMYYQLFTGKVELE